MGILSSRAPVLPRLSLLLLICVGVMGALGISGCGSKPNSNKVSSALFLAPITEAPRANGRGGIEVIADRLDFLRAIRPNDLDSQLVDFPAEATVLGRLSSSTPDKNGNPTLTNDLLVYEANTRSILSVDMCPDPTGPKCGTVRLHYNQKGLDLEQGQGSVLSTDVTPLKLRNGWIVAFDSSTKNLVAFREQDPRQVTDDIDGDGTPEPRTVPYRSATRPDGTVDSGSKNVGDGNGLILSVVISGEEAQDQLAATSEPTVSRIVEIEENKLLVFFAAGLRQASVELLELREETATHDFELDPPLRPSEQLEVKILRGEYKRFPGIPGDFLTYSTIGKQVTQNAALELAQFQPVLIPNAASSNPNTPPYPGVVLVFDQNTSIFFKVGVAHNLAGDIIGATTATAVPCEDLSRVLQVTACSLTKPQWLLPRGAYYNSLPNHKAILIFEERTRTVLAYDYTADIGKNLSIFVNSSGFLNRRNPRGTQSPGSKPAVIDFAVGDVNLNRLGFDLGLEQIISISYPSSVVVVVADSTEIGKVTLDPITIISYIEPLDDTNVRAFDSRSTSLLRVRLQYAALPIFTTNN